MTVWHVFAQVCLPIFVLMGCGWLLDRKFQLDLGTMVKLNIYLLVPAFIFVQIVSSPLNTLDAFRVVLFTICIIAVMFALSGLAGSLGRYKSSERRSLQLATMFYNSGNYGIPLMTLSFPALGPLLQVFVILTQNVAMFTIGVLLAASGQQRGWRALLPMLRQVSIWAVAAAVLARTFEAPVQQWRWLWVPLEYLSAALVAVAVITLGAQLSQTRHKLEHVPRLAWALGLRLLAGPAAAFLLIPLFGFRGEEAAVMVLSSAFPTAVNTSLLAHEFRADSDFAAAAVFYSTLASMVTVTVLVTILRAVA